MADHQVPCEMATRARRPSRRNFQYILLCQLSHDIRFRAACASITQKMALHFKLWHAVTYMIIMSRLPLWQLPIVSVVTT